MRLLGFIIYGLSFTFLFVVCNSPRTLLHPEYHAEITNEKNAPAEDKIKLTIELKTGKALFKTNCASCHNKNMSEDLTGPALKNVKERWSSYPEKDLYAWIKNAPLLTASGHPYAKEISRFSNADMPIFNNLKDEDIKVILEWIDFVGS